jgi:DNA ligase-1
LLTGGFRIEVSAKLITRALSLSTGQPEPQLTHKLMSNWTPDTVTWETLIEAKDPTADQSHPYPFYLAHQLDGFDALGDPTEWSASGNGIAFAGNLSSAAVLITCGHAAKT